MGMSEDSRDYDVVLMGASGFTGQLVAQYLLNTYGADGDLRWAIAGRNEAKLQQVRDALEGYNPRKPLDILVVDSQDAAGLAEMAARTRVVCTTVGPYALYGSQLVEACVKTGTHYCDLTGEVQWMREMITAHQSAAEASGARIVHTCGFDSIPSDLGVLFIQNAMQERHGVTSPRVKYRAQGFAGGFSGGTVASMLNMFEEMRKDPGLAKTMADPYSLLPEGAPRGKDGPDQTGAVFDEDFMRWTVPFVMAGINTRVVRRSNALMDFPWGEEFRYDEATLLPEKRSALQARLAAGAAGMGMLALAVPPLRAVTKLFLPKPGEGPSPEQQEKGYFDVRLFAAHPVEPTSSLLATVYGDRDPGYGSTAKMLGESAVCLAHDPLDCAGGFWTPASAMGTLLISRLQEKAGVTFTIDS
jgi:short subunit dehydrogenase-like uncharacterized protein